MPQPTLDYASAIRTPRRRLMPALAIALLLGPVLAVAAAVLGCCFALGSWTLSPANLSYSVTWGVAFGVVGAPSTAGLALAWRRNAMTVSVVGSAIVAAASGGSLLIYALMLAAV